MAEKKIEMGCYYCKFRTKIYCNKKKRGVAGTGFSQSVFIEKDLLAITEAHDKIHIGKPYGYLCKDFERNPKFTAIFVFR